MHRPYARPRLSRWQPLRQPIRPFRPGWQAGQATSRLSATDGAGPSSCARWVSLMPAGPRYETSTVWRPWLKRSSRCQRSIRSGMSRARDNACTTGSGAIARAPSAILRMARGPCTAITPARTSLFWALGTCAPVGTETGTEIPCCFSPRTTSRIMAADAKSCPSSCLFIGPAPHAAENRLTRAECSKERMLARNGRPQIMTVAFPSQNGDMCRMRVASP